MCTDGRVCCYLSRKEIQCRTVYSVILSCVYKHIPSQNTHACTNTCAQAHTHIHTRTAEQLGLLISFGVSLAEGIVPTRGCHDNNASSHYTTFQHPPHSANPLPYSEPWQSNLPSLWRTSSGSRATTCLHHSIAFHKYLSQCNPRNEDTGIYVYNATKCTASRECYLGLG